MTDVDDAIQVAMDPAGCIGQRAGLLRLDAKPHLARIDERVVDAAKRDIDADLAQFRDIDRNVQVLDKAWNHVERNPLAFAVCACCAGGHQSRRRIQPDHGLRLAHGDHARFQQHGCDADAVGAGHGMGLVALEDDEAGIGFIRHRRE